MNKKFKETFKNIKPKTITQKDAPTKDNIFEMIGYKNDTAKKIKKAKVKLNKNLN